MNEWLTENEVRAITQRVRPSAQLRQLEALGMSDRVRFRTDGSFLVKRLQQAQNPKPEKNYSLDFTDFGDGTQAA